MSAPGEIVVLVEHDRGVAPDTAHQAFGFARALLGAGVGSSITAVVVGNDGDALAEHLGTYGADEVLLVHHAELSDYAPEAWGDAVVAAVAGRQVVSYVATGTDRGNEVLAHIAAATDIPFAANVSEIGALDNDGLGLTRVRWGGSLLEQSRLAPDTAALSAAAHVFDGDPSAAHLDHVAAVSTVDIALPESAARTRIVDRVTLSSGITLTTAAVVVSGGRGVGSADGFAPLEELAGLLGGAVGCSRVVTNNGWRPHSDQVGQTGKRIAPELYIACGISGAIQHWVGMMASKHVLAINTDGEANMVGKAEYAVVGDLHKIVPAISDEIRRRRSS